MGTGKTVRDSQYIDNYLFAFHVLLPDDECFFFFYPNRSYFNTTHTPRICFVRFFILFFFFYVPFFYLYCIYTSNINDYVNFGNDVLTSELLSDQDFISSLNNQPEEDLSISSVFHAVKVHTNRKTDFFFFNTT